MMNVNNKEKMSKDCSCCETQREDMMATMMASMLTSAALAALIAGDDMPDASPMDLLSKKDCKRMDAYLEKHYGPLREFIDENYVALLMSLAQYEKVDFDARIKAHIVHNITSGE